MPDKVDEITIHAGRVDITAASRRFGRHPVTLARWETQGILPRSHRVGGRRCWFADELDECERRLAEIERARPPRATPEQARALAAVGRAAKDQKKALREAAGRVLEIGGADLVVLSLAKWTRSGRIDLILPEHRAEAIAALRDTISLFGSDDDSEVAP
jgi:hypothetical protein